MPKLIKIFTVLILAALIMIGCGSNKDTPKDNTSAIKDNENEAPNEPVKEDEENENEEAEEEEESQQELELYENKINVYEELHTAWNNIEKMHVPKELPFPKDELSKNTTFFSTLELDDMSIHFRHKDYEQISIHSGDNEYQMKDDDTELYDTINGMEFYKNDNEIMYTYEDMDYSFRIKDHDDEEIDEILSLLADLEPLGEKPVTFDFEKYPMPTMLPFEEGQELAIRVFTTYKPEEYREEDNSHEFRLRFRQSSDIDGSSDVPDVEVQLRDDKPPHFMNEEKGDIIEDEGIEYFITYVKDKSIKITWFEEESEMYYEATLGIKDPEEHLDFILEWLNTFE